VGVGVLWCECDKTNIIFMLTEETFVLALQALFSWLLISLVTQFVINVLVSQFASHISVHWTYFKINEKEFSFIYIYIYVCVCACVYVRTM
jgi:hypothetical protein